MSLKVPTVFKRDVISEQLLFRQAANSELLLDDEQPGPSTAPLQAGRHLSQE